MALDSVQPTPLPVMPEDARPIPGLEHYRIDRTGRVWARQKRAWLPRAVRVRPDGYVAIVLTRKRTTREPGRLPQRYALVHALVLEAFVGPRPSPEHHGRHLDGNRTNNIPENLAWGTRHDNLMDAYRHGTMGGGRDPWTPERLLDVYGRASRGERRKDIARDYGVSKEMICAVVRKERARRGLPQLRNGCSLAERLSQPW